MMDTLDGTEWDVLIAGKSVLHIDRHAYYGGSEAAFSLQEAEEFAKELALPRQGLTEFTDAKLEKQQASEPQRLSFSRAYTLALNPSIIYAKSPLINGLVDSQLDSQLEFLAVGEWFTFQYDQDKTKQLLRIPSSREGIFTDQNVKPEDKRRLMKFLRFIVDFESHEEDWNGFASFEDFLTTKFHLDHTNVTRFIQALALSPANTSQTTTGYALARVARHLRSYGVFGSNFSAVVPRWGGLSEISQVSCRASAVAGSVYMLGNGISDIRSPESTLGDQASYLAVQLNRGESVRAKNIVCSLGQAPTGALQESASNVLEPRHEPKMSQMISIVTSPLETLFPSLGENAPVPACAVVIVDPTSEAAMRHGLAVEDLPPVHIVVHSSDTGECPTGQSVIYSSIALGKQKGYVVLSEAVEALVSNISPSAEIPWQLKYERLRPTSPDIYIQSDRSVKVLAPISAETALGDDILSRVKLVWQDIVGLDAEGFLVPPEPAPRGTSDDEFSDVLNED